jgi:hypothetical protein
MKNQCFGTACNTVPTSQVPELPRPDWITTRTLANDIGAPLAVVRLVEQTLRDKFEIRQGPIPMSAHNCTYDWMAESAKGIRAYWFNPDNGLKSMNQLATIRIEIPGAVCASVPQVDLRDLMKLLDEGFSTICTRFDVALDDYTKSLWTWEDLEDAARKKNFSGVKNRQKIDDFESGVTYYFGTRKSETFYRFYNKSVESEGKQDCYRMEVEFKRSKAQQVFAAWLQPAIGDEIEAGQVLSEFLMGNINFIDREKGDKNLKRCPELPWWENMKRIIAQGVKLAPIRPIETIERTIEWVEKKVGPSLYAIQRVIGVDAMGAFLDSVMEWGRQHQNSRHDTLVDVAKLEGWSA